jgi:hypothetical protein
MTADIRDYLTQFRGQEVAYFPNPGNGGDSVIAAATYQQLEAAGIRYYTPHPARFDPAGRIVIYGGGGNLVGSSTHSARLLRRLHSTARHLTILPHTVKDVDALLGEFGSNVVLICRERVSYDYARQRRGQYDVLLMDDMAFSLDMDRLMSGRDRFSAPAMLGDFLASKLLRRSSHTIFDNVRRYLNPGPVAARLQAHAAGGALHAFRRDGEATDIAIPEDNVDLSTVFMFGVTPAPVAHHAARSLVLTLLRFDEIRTNRLHVAISAGLAGRKTLFYPNNYYKCRAVYEFSMQHRFPHVTWMG